MKGGGESYDEAERKLSALGRIIKREGQRTIIRRRTATRAEVKKGKCPCKLGSVSSNKTDVGYVGVENRRLSFATSEKKKKKEETGQRDIRLWRNCKKNERTRSSGVETMFQGFCMSEGGEEAW